MRTATRPPRKQRNAALPLSSAARPGCRRSTGLCKVEHPHLASFDLMIAPIGGDGRTWEAVFNRLQLA